MTNDASFLLGMLTGIALVGYTAVLYRMTSNALRGSRQKPHQAPPLGRSARMLAMCWAIQDELKV